MYLAKNKIRVIKRQERERQQEEEKTSDQDLNAKRDAHKKKQQEPASTVKEWANDFLRRRQHS